MVITFILLSLLTGLQDPPTLPAHIQAALDAPDRPEADRVRDAARKPGEVLTFAGLKPGHKVIELMAGNGYYAHILAHAVGEEGTLLLHNSPFVLQRFAEKGVQERMAMLEGLPVKRLDRDLDKLTLKENSQDLILMVLFYHDTYWQEVDRKTMNQQILRMLKPGGVFLIIDHHAEAGSGDRDVRTIHRVDAELVKKEILAAGFQWSGESNLLAHPEDDRTVNVFDPSIRGKTDRFIYKFSKPKP